MTRRNAPFSVSRRGALSYALALGLSIDFLGARAFAASDSARSAKKLVVVVCRGGLDGLSLSPPVGDANYHALRGPIAIAPVGEAGGALPLDATFGLHPALVATHALATRGQARIAPAVATPDRERSHFEAQDVLESGAGAVYATTSGWLNRALEAMGPAGAVKAISVGPTTPLILRGRIEAASWSPGGGAQRDSRLPGILQDLYAHDGLLGPALASGLATEAMAKIAVAHEMQAVPTQASDPAQIERNQMQADAGGKDLRDYVRPGLDQSRKLGGALSGFMTQPQGAQVAAVSVDGFDTHANQGASQGLLASRLAYLDAFLDGFAQGMGEGWNDTIVIAATEFGRTARVNGTNGTDHGTASTALLLGGALRRGGIVGDWPTLAQSRLFENRDTWPALDMRSLFKGVLRDHMGVDRADLDRVVFPNSAAAAPAEAIV